MENFKNEIWRDIPGFEGRYQASTLGRIKALKKIRIQPLFGGIRIYPEKIMKHRITDRGYHDLNLSKNGKKKSYRVQRLVAITFLANPKNLPQVNHINGVKSDNTPYNLEWCTQKQNNDHARKTGLNNNFGSGHHTAKLTEEDVIDIRDKYTNGTSQKKLSSKYNVSVQQINHIISRKHWNHI